MAETNELQYTINDLMELSLSYIPFISGGGLFIPTQDMFSLGTSIVVTLQIPGKRDSMRIEGKVVWVTPKNALHHVLMGIGIQFIGPDAKTNDEQIQGFLDKTLEIGGYTYGIMGATKK